METLTRALARREDKIAHHVSNLKKIATREIPPGHALCVELEKLDRTEVDFRTFLKAFLKSVREYVLEENEEDNKVAPEDEIDIDMLEEEDDGDNPAGDPDYDGYHSSEAEDGEEVIMADDASEVEDDDDVW